MEGRSEIVYDVILKRFEHPDEVRNFEKGKFELVHLGSMTVARASYEPEWKWSLHVGKSTGARSCMVEHVGLVLSGRATAAMDDTLRRDTTVGSSGMSPTYRCTLLGAGEYARG